MKIRNGVSRLNGFLKSKRRWLWAGVAVLITICLVAIPIVVFWDWLTHGESGSATIRNLGLVLAGIIALPLAIWRSIVAQKQANAAQRQSDTAQRSLLNERYQKAAEMLGSPVLPVRLGGIYALQSLADEHPKEFHVQAMRLLCSFVRNPIHDETLRPTEFQKELKIEIRQDVDAAIKVIGGRHESSIVLERNSEFELDLKGADMRGIQLGNVNLSRAMFHDAQFAYANVWNTDMTDVFLTSANLFNAEFSRMKMKQVRFWRNSDISKSRFHHSDMRKASFSYSSMYDVSFDRIDLSGAEIVNSDLSGNSFFFNCNLSKTNISEVNLSGVSFSGSDLSEATILKSDMSGVNLRDTNLSGADFYFAAPNTTPQPVTGLTQSQLDQARADPNNPPEVDKVLDAQTGKLLVWRGKPLKDDD